MDISEQQKQTKEFFELHANDWYKYATSDSNKSVNIIKIRNQYVEKICSMLLSTNSKILDVGCGVGDLVISLRKMNYESYGIDFASSMIEKAKESAKKNNMDSNFFFTGSFLDFESQMKYNLISANGFIEYLSEIQLDDFLHKCFNLLDDGGILVIESRNRLFNTFSYNNYTKEEIAIGQLNSLLEECILFNSAKNFNELFDCNFKSNLSVNLQKHERTKTDSTIVTVDKRYQYTPFQVIEYLRNNGFKVFDLMPYHIHALTTGAKEMEPEIHTRLSYYLQETVNSIPPIVPQSSSFMIACKKK